MLLNVIGKTMKTIVKEIGLCAEKSYYCRPETTILQGPACKVNPWLTSWKLAGKQFSSGKLASK